MIGCYLRALHGGEERFVAQGVDLLLPFRLCLIRRVDVLDITALNGFDHIRDPPSLHLDGSRSVGEQGGTLRSIEMEHIWIPSDGGSQIGIGRSLPLVVKRLTIDVAKSHGRHAAGDDIEARSDADDVEVVVRAVLQVDARFIEIGDGVVLNVNDVDVISIELLEVRILETRSLDAPEVWFFERCKQVPLPWVVDARSLLLGPEVVCLLVGLRVKQVVLVVAQPKAEASILPKLFVERLSFFWRIVEGASFGEVVEEASEAVLAKSKKFGVPLLGYLLLFDCKISLAHRDGQVRSPLEDLDVTRLWAPCLRYLNTCCTSSDDGTLLAFDRDLFVGPERGMMNDPFEIVDPGPIRDVSLSRKASADDQVLGFSSSAVRCLYVPASFPGFELGVDNNALESCLAFDVDNLVASIEIVSQVVVIRVVVWPIVSDACQLSIRAIFDCCTNALMTSGMFS